MLTITTDNGIELRNHKAIAKALGCTAYFADPYCSRQKGAVENANKIFREFFPKWADFRKVTQHELDVAEYMINDRPRKNSDSPLPKLSPIGGSINLHLPVDSTLALIRKIKALDLSLTPTLDFARDMFMKSSYLRGMSFIDTAFLKKTNLKTATSHTGAARPGSK